MMKVVHISTSMTGGAGIAAYRLHKGLVAGGGCKSTFVCQNAGRYAGEEHIVELKSRPLTIFDRALRKMNMLPNKAADFNRKLKNYPGSYEIATWPETNYRVELEKVVLDADVVHLHWVAGFLNYPSFFRKLRGKHIVWTLHDMNPFMGIFHYGGDQMRNPQLSQLDLQSLHIKTKALTGIEYLCINALSKWIGDEAIKNAAFGRFAINSIPNGIDLGLFRPVERRVARQKLGQDTEGLVLLCVSENLDNYRKGIDLLLEALELLKSNISIRLISVGRGVLQPPEKIDYTAFGPISDEEKLALIYASADAFVTTAREDNLPNVMLEALACGTPVIGFPVGGQKDYIVPFETGVLAKEVTAKSFCMAIEEFLSSRNRFDPDKIAAFAKLHFDRGKYINDHLALYNKMLNRYKKL